MWGGLMAYELATLPLITYFFRPHSPDQGHCAGYSALAHFSPPPALPSIRAIELGAVLLLENLDEDMDDVIEQAGGEGEGEGGGRKGELHTLQ